MCRRYFYSPAGRLDSIQAREQGTWELHLTQEWNPDGSLRNRNGVVDRVRYLSDCTSDCFSPVQVVMFTQYFYDAQGRLVTMRVDDAGVQTTWMTAVRYDALGRRIMVWEDTASSSGLITRSIYDRDNLAYTSTAPGTNPDLDTPTQITLDPLSGQGLASREVTAAIKFIHRNDLGSVSEVTTPSGTRDTQPVVAPVYTSFGDPGGDVSLFFKGNDAFTGAPTLPEAGDVSLVYLRNRYYDPNTGRFTQEDPIGFAGGVNLYAYAGSNPTTFTDPFGLFPEPTVLSGAILLGLGAGAVTSVILVTQGEALGSALTGGIEVGREAVSSIAASVGSRLRSLIAGLLLGTSPAQGTLTDDPSVVGNPGVEQVQPPREEDEAASGDGGDGPGGGR